MRALSSEAAVACINDGQLVAHATTTLLGIAAAPLHASAVTKLDALKSRVTGRGYVHVCDTPERAEGWIVDVEAAAAVWRSLDGPVTLIVPAGPLAPLSVLGPGHTLALRLDHHPAVRALCQGTQSPIISTSLNLPQQTPIADITRVPAELTRHLAGSLTGSPEPLGTPSTLLKQTGHHWRVLREGSLSGAAINELLGGIVIHE
ncbi:MAG: Sua5/YciO/YrdC/YwlC family protein [Myxococcales bacterium]|nr:Sua5/YciO/YrdC/YwlC family protein [Myxococcales bacterium]